VSKPDSLGPNTSEGAVWIDEKVKAGQASEPFLFAGWPERICWILNDSENSVEYVFEVDKPGNWTGEAYKCHFTAGESQYIDFESNSPGEWIRIKVDKETTASAHFFFTGNECQNCLLTWYIYRIITYY
jgi:hypothetical protein